MFLLSPEYATIGEGAAEVTARIATLSIWTRKMSGSTARYPPQQASAKFLVRSIVSLNTEQAKF